MSTMFEPLIAIICDAATGEQVALLPLIRRLQKRYSDYRITPISVRPTIMRRCLWRRPPRDAGAACALWRDLKAALRGARRRPISFGCKMPVELDAGPIRWRLLDDAGRVRSTQPSSRPAMISTLTRYSMDRTVRKELERSWRVFIRHPAAAFKIITDKNKPENSLDHGVQQGTRMQRLGLNFVLNDETCAAFIAIWSTAVLTAVMSWCPR